MMEATVAVSGSDAGTKSNNFKLTPGDVDVDEGVKLHYELRSPNSLPSGAITEKVIMVQGALATLKNFDEIANVLAERFNAKSKTPFEVLIFDNRGMGRSTAPFKNQTTRLLASDALTLINKVWGDSTAVHVIGISLGGMISQELAVYLAKAKRLRSLYLAVSFRGNYIRPLAVLGASGWSWLLPLMMKGDKERIVRDFLIGSCFADDTPKDQLEKFTKLWTEKCDELFAISDIKACACQMTANSSHYFNDEGVRTIVDSKVPVTVQVSTKDRVIAPKDQHFLADSLKAKKVELPQGHMIDDRGKGAMFQAMISHLEEASKQ